MVDPRGFVFWFDENDKLAGRAFDDGTIEPYPPGSWGTKFDVGIATAKPLFIGMDLRDCPEEITRRAKFASKNSPNDQGIRHGKDHGMTEKKISGVGVPPPGWTGGTLPDGRYKVRELADGRRCIDWVGPREEASSVQPNSDTSSDRSFPSDNGSVDGSPAYVQQNGKRTVAYSGLDNVGKVVTNDEENASYLRNDDGTVVLNDQADDPYNPPPWNRH